MTINKYITIYYLGNITKGEKTYHHIDRQKITRQDVIWFGDMVKAQASHRWHTRNTFVSLPRHGKDLSCQCQPGDETLRQRILFSELWLWQWKSNIDLSALGELRLHMAIRIPRVRSQCL